MTPFDDLACCWAIQQDNESISKGEAAAWRRCFPLGEGDEEGEGMAQNRFPIGRFHAAAVAGLNGRTRPFVT